MTNDGALDADTTAGVAGNARDDRGQAAKAPSCTLVIFGAGGDLTKRLLMPALYNLTA